MNFILKQTFTLFNAFLSSLKTHLNAFHFGLDSIKVLDSIESVPREFVPIKTMQNHIKANIHYFIAFITLICLNLDNLQIWSRVKFKYKPEQMTDLIIHKTFPKEFWLQSNVASNIGLWMETFIFGLLSFGPQLNSMFLFYRVFNSQNQNNEIFFNGKGNI